MPSSSRVLDAGFVSDARGQDKEHDSAAKLASGDPAALWLCGRYLGQRLDRERGRASSELVALHREVTRRLADPKASEARERLRRRVEMAKVLRWRVGSVRSELDGSAAASLEQMRRRSASQF